MKLECSDKEVKAIGERRYMNTRWKKAFILPVLALVATLVAMAILPDNGDIYAALVGGVLFLYFYWRVMSVMTMAGNALLKELKDREAKNG